MTVAFIRTGSAAARPEHATAREIASDEVLIRRIAGGDQLAMQTLLRAIELRCTAGCCASYATRPWPKTS
jgi:hypothetical protein